MAEAATILELDLMRIFCGGIAVYGGTGLTGAITGNATGGSGTGSSYSSGGSVDPYAGITVVYNPVTGQITTTDPSFTQEILTLNPQNPNIVVGEDLVLTLRKKLTLELEEGRIIRPLTLEFEEPTIISGPGSNGTLTLEIEEGTIVGGLNHGRPVSDVVGEQPSSGGSSPGVIGTIKRGARVTLQKDGMVVSYEFDAYFGTSGNDTITGSGLLLGYEGNDSLTGGIGNDTLDGGMGNDYLVGNEGADQLDGGAGNDWLDGGTGADRLDGGDGWDVASYLLSATSGVTVNLTTNANGGAAAGDKLLNVEAVEGSNYGDTLVGLLREGGQGVELSGKGGNDTLIGKAGADRLYGGDDNDWIDGGAGSDTMDGGAGWDLVYYRDATSGIIVNLTTNENGGAAAGDVLINFEAVQGSNYNDVITGIHRGGGHGVELHGEGGDDVLIGKEGGDRLYGDDGNDWLDGGAGGDILEGWAGWDLVSYKSASSGVAVNMATNANGGAAYGDVLSNIEVLQGSDYDDSLTGVDRGGGNGVELHGEGGNDQLRGAAGGDRLYGDNGNDWLAGLQGSDLVYGGDGNDVVGGQEGNDTLNGGNGSDEMWGGSGADWFLFDTALGAGNVDQLKDFSSAEGDMIILNRNVFSALGIGVLSGSAFKVGAATSTSHKILYNAYTGDLSYDVDGWGAAAAVKIATLNPGTALGASNFFVV